MLWRHRMSRPADNPWVVLIVEDSHVYRAILDIYLREIAGTVLAVENGALALEVLNKRRIDLIVTDLTMPVMDGAELVRAVRAHPDRKIRTTPVILLTAEKKDDVLMDAGAAGANALVSKPITPTALRLAVNRLLLPAVQTPAPAGLGAR